VQVQGRNACPKQIEALRELMNKYAAPTELDEVQGVGGYRDGAPTELFELVHGRKAHSMNVDRLAL